MPKLVTFNTWVSEYDPRRTSVPVTINPAEVSDIEDYCGTIRPGSQITLKNKKTFLVEGVHADIVAALTAESAS